MDHCIGFGVRIHPKQGQGISSVNYVSFRKIWCYWLSTFFERTPQTNTTMRIFCRLAIAGLSAVAVDAFSAAITPSTKLPSVNLHSGFPPDMVDIASYAADKSMIIVGLPGAVRSWIDLCMCFIISPFFLFLLFSSHQREF